MPCEAVAATAVFMERMPDPYKALASSERILPAPFVQMGVATLPGSMRTTSMPHAFNSIRSASVMASRANLEAQYAPANGNTFSPPTDPMLTMRPRARRSNGKNACVTATCPVTLTSNCRLKESSGTNSIGPGSTTPALLTSPSSPASPTAASTSAAARRMASASVTSR